MSLLLSAKSITWANTLAYNGICTFRISNVFIVQAQDVGISISMLQGPNIYYIPLSGKDSATFVYKIRKLFDVYDSDQLWIFTSMPTSLLSFRLRALTFPSL